VTKITRDPFRLQPTINACMETIALLDWLPFRSATPATSARHAPAPGAASDESLMLRYRDGDDDAFALLYARHRGALLRFARHLCHHAAEAEEIFQETWMAVIAARSRYRHSASFITWLFAIAHRRVADSRRKRARRPADTGVEFDELPTSSAATDPPQRALDDARDRALRAAVARLPFEQREVFLLRAETGLGLADIARITRARPEATKSRLRYALRALRKSLEEWT
jgi:RNA polymerase sigma factor (sigma-70 family)